jgi:hypothetical protein
VVARVSTWDGAGTDRCSEGEREKAAFEKPGRLAEAFSAAMKPQLPGAPLLRIPHQALQGVEDGQFDARVLDLDCRRRSVRGRRDRGLPLREKAWRRIAKRNGPT